MTFVSKCVTIQLKQVGRGGGGGGGAGGRDKNCLNTWTLHKGTSCPSSHSISVTTLARSGPRYPIAVSCHCVQSELPRHGHWQPAPPPSLFPGHTRTKQFELNFQYGEPVWPSGTGKQKDFGSNPLRLSFLFKCCGLWTLSCDFVPHNYEILKWLSSLPIVMQESFCWWQCSDSI